MPIKLSKEKPPIYDRLKDTFGIDWDSGVVITYGDTVYCKNDLSRDLEIHEATHIRQQDKIGADEWWERFFNDPEFRVKQEAEAYRNQWQYLKQVSKDRMGLYKARAFMIDCLSGPFYGNACSKERASKLIGR